MKRITKALLAPAFALLLHSNAFSKGIINNGSPKDSKNSFCTFTVTCTHNNVLCNGGNTGSATANPSGGTPPYTYAWAPSGGNSITATGLTTGSYTVTVTDFVGCTSTATAYVTQPTPLSIVGLVNDTVCTGACTGVLNMTPWGGTPPYLYAWSNGFTTYSATGLCAGSYTATVTDQNGCSASASAIVSIHSNIPTFTVVPTITNATCAGSSDGSISLAASGPTAPFRYEWQNKYYTGNSFNNLTQGTYSVIITDALYNCTPLTYTVGVNYTCGNVSGKTFNDTNFNCTYNAGEPGLKDSYITINPGSYVVYPDINGNYNQQNVPYGSYTVTQTLFAGSPFAACSSSQPVTVSAATPSVNFADSTHSALSDPMITYFYTSNLFVGNPCSAALQIVNNGSAPSNGKTFFMVPDSLSLLTTVPAYSYLNYDTIFWNYSGLLPGDTLNYTINCIISKNIGLEGFFACGFAGVIPGNPESNSANNIAERCDFIGVPCDPNNKSVYPNGIGPNGYINLTDSILTYTIHFQNVGSAKATNIYIVDTISSHLDMSTLNVLGASNAYSYTYTGNRVKFTFSNINLPDSNGNQAGSKGWIQYQIHQSKSNNPGDVMNNTAYIYFDYNSPVITNTTVNTINLPLGEQNITNAGIVNIFPNPNNGKFSLEIKNSQLGINNRVEIYNALGENIYNQTLPQAQSNNTIDLGGKSAGIYLYRVLTQKGNLVGEGKFVIQ